MGRRTRWASFWIIMLLLLPGLAEGIAQGSQTMTRCASVYGDPRDAQDGLDIKQAALDVQKNKVVVRLEMWEPWSNLALQISCTHACWDSDRNNMWVHFGDREALKEARIIYWQGRLRVQLIDFRDPPSTPEEANDPNYYPEWPAVRPDNKSVEFSLPLKAVLPSGGADRFDWNVETQMKEPLVADWAPNPGEGENAYGQSAYVYMLTTKRQEMETLGRDASFFDPSEPSESPILDLRALSVGRELSELLVGLEVNEPLATPPPGTLTWMFDVGKKKFVLEFSSDPSTGDSYTLYERKGAKLSKPITVKGTVEGNSDGDGFVVNFRIPLEQVAPTNWRGLAVSGSVQGDMPDVSSSIDPGGAGRQRLDEMTTNRSFVLC